MGTNGHSNGKTRPGALSALGFQLRIAVPVLPWIWTSHVLLAGGARRCPSLGVSQPRPAPSLGAEGEQEDGEETHFFASPAISK